MPVKQKPKAVVVVRQRKRLRKKNIYFAKGSTNGFRIFYFSTKSKILSHRMQVSGVVNIAELHADVDDMKY